MTQSNKKKIPLKRLAIVELRMLDGEKIYSDEKSWIGIQKEDVFVAKEYKKQVGGTFKIDGNTLINPKYCVLGRPMMATIDMNK